MSRSIHIYCDGGFGNRFNGLLSGLLLADAAGLQPVVVWPRNNWCGASYAQLIASKANVIERELASYVPEKDDFQFFMTEDHLNMGVENKSPLQTESLADALTYLAKSFKDVYFHTPLIPTFFDTQKLHVMVRNLQFTVALYERARQFIADSDLVDFLGMQIRKTDFGANAADDNNLFDLVTSCPQKQFFVCSDSKEVEQRFQTLPNVAVYPKRAHVELMVPGEWSTTTADYSGRLYASNVNRNDVSVEDAVVDLLILARSQIVRTSNSTFLNTALLLKQAGAEYPPVVTAETNRLSVDMPSLDRYFQSHFEYFGHPIQVDISPDQHTRLFTRIQEQWTVYGANSPYTSVLSDEKYLMSRIEKNRGEFNESGETPVTCFQTLAARNDVKIPKGSCFELGCGVGRVTKPLAGIFDRVVAADISPGNLALCKSYMQQSHRDNVETMLLQSPGDITLVDHFDVFFSIIVLQHNPPPIQYYLLDQILNKVNPGGLCFFQTLTYNPGYAYSAEFQLALDKQAFEQWSIHCLPMRHIMDIFRKHGFEVCEVVQDGLARGMQNKFHSHTFFAQRTTGTHSQI